MSEETQKLETQIAANPQVAEIVDLALKDVNPQLHEQIFLFLVKCKIKPDDPLFIVMLCCRYFNLLTFNLPQEIQNAFERGTTNLHGEINNKVNNLSQDFYAGAVKSVEAEIGKAVNHLLEQKDKPTRKKRWLNYGKYAALTLIPLILGIFGTRQYYEISGLTQFNIENQQLVGWGRSQEGKLARKIMQWNQGLVDGSCEKAVANLGVGFGDALVKNGETIGIRRATKGYCVVWRVPPNQRKFQ